MTDHRARNHLGIATARSAVPLEHGHHVQRASAQPERFWQACEGGFSRLAWALRRSETVCEEGKYDRAVVRTSEP